MNPWQLLSQKYVQKVIPFIFCEVLLPQKEKKEIHELIFSHGCHGLQYCSWARTHDDDVGNGDAQDGEYTLADRLTELRSQRMLYVVNLEN